MSAQFHRITTVFLVVMILANLLGACKGTTPTAPPVATSTPAPPPTPTATPLPFPKSVDLVHELSIAGSAVTSQPDCLQLLEGMTDGIVLGVNPQTCQVPDQGDTRATLVVYVPDQYAGQVFTLKLSWPDENGRGLRSSFPEKTAQISLDGDIMWEKSALVSMENGFYYAARSEPIALTFVPKAAGNHTIDISLPAGMSWDIGTIDLHATPYPTNIMGIAYSPYRDCQNASTDLQPVEQDIQADLYKLAQSATAIRTYSSTGINAEVPRLATAMGIPVYAGAWIDGNDGADDLEMAGIATIAETSPIKAAIIGNEYHLRHSKEPGDLDYLLLRINEFKNAYPNIPVGTAETDGLIFDWSGDGLLTIKPEYKPILEQVDILFIHIYPFWAELPREGAAEYTINRYLAIKALLDDEYGGTKRVIIGEAGWPAQGGPNPTNASGQGDNANQTIILSTPGDQRQYMIELLALAQQNQVDLFFFDAFDELWKNEGIGGAGRTWGYNYSDRTVKYNFSGLLIPPEDLPSPAQGDIYDPYKGSDFTWSVGAYPVYTDWPGDPRFQENPPPGRPYSPAYMDNPDTLGNAEAISVFQCERHSHGGETAVRVTFQPGLTRDWSGAYWLYSLEDAAQGLQDPTEKYWVVSPLGNNLVASKTLTFWARGEKGGEVIEFITGGICIKPDPEKLPICPDTVQPRVSTGPILLTDTWQKYTLDFGNKDLSSVVGAFGFTVSHIYNPGGATFYLDDIEFSPDPPMADEQTYPLPIGSEFAIYRDDTALDNHYIPSNFMGDGETEGYLTLTPNWGQNPLSGLTSIQIQYNGGPNGWGGIYWTDPDGNWGERPGGYDLTGVTSLTFWARSDIPGYPLKILVGGINCFKSAFPYRDSVCDVVPIPWYALTTEWTQYTIDLTKVERDWSSLLGGFGIVVNKPGTVYLDDIVYHLNK